MTGYAGVLFDKDGTLFDFGKTWGAWARAFLGDVSRGDDVLADTLADAIGYDPVTGLFSPTSPVIAGTPGEIAELLLPHLPGANPSSLISHMNVTAAEISQVEVVPLQPLLGALRTRGIKLGVATNDAEMPARAHLRNAGVADLFDFVAGCDSGFGAKPDPGQCIGFAQTMNIPPAKIVMVGDSRHDLLAGRAAGMATVAVLNGLASECDLTPLADMVLPDIGALPAWLDRSRVAVTAA